MRGDCLILRCTNAGKRSPGRRSRLLPSALHSFLSSTFPRTTNRIGTTVLSIFGNFRFLGDIYRHSYHLSESLSTWNFRSCEHSLPRTIANVIELGMEFGPSTPFFGYAVWCGAICTHRRHQQLQ